MKNTGSEDGLELHLYISARIAVTSSEPMLTQGVLQMGYRRLRNTQAGMMAPECPHLSKTWLWLIESTWDKEWLHLQKIIVHGLNMRTLTSDPPLWNLKKVRIQFPRN